VVLGGERHLQTLFPENDGKLMVIGGKFDNLQEAEGTFTRSFQGKSMNESNHNTRCQLNFPPEIRDSRPPAGFFHVRGKEPISAGRSAY
jgi:hypothetical protein